MMNAAKVAFAVALAVFFVAEIHLTRRAIETIVMPSTETKDRK